MRRKATAKSIRKGKLLKIRQDLFKSEDRQTYVLAMAHLLNMTEPDRKWASKRFVKSDEKAALFDGTKVLPKDEVHVVKLV